MREEMRNIVRSPLLYLAAGLMLFGFLGFSLPVWFKDSGDIAYKSTALEQSIGGIFFGAMMLFMPLCSTLPTGVTQVDEVRGSMLRWRTLRGGLKRYLVVKSCSAMLTAMLVTSGIFLLHAVVWNQVAVRHDPAIYPMHNNFFSSASLYYKWFEINHGLPIYLSMSAGMGISAAVWSIVGLATAVWVPDKLLAISIPYCLYALIGTQLSYYLVGVRVPHPSTLFNDALTIQDIWQTLVMYGILMALAFMMYGAGVNRRVRHG